MFVSLLAPNVALVLPENPDHVICPAHNLFL